MTDIFGRYFELELIELVQVEIHVFIYLTLFIWAHWKKHCLLRFHSDRSVVWHQMLKPVCASARDNT